MCLKEYNYCWILLNEIIIQLKSFTCWNLVRTTLLNQIKEFLRLGIIYYIGLSSPSVDLNVAEMWDLMNDFVKEEDKGILTALKDIIQPGEHIQLDVYTYIKVLFNI